METFKCGQLQTLFLSSVLIITAGCSGGGGGSDAASVQPPPPPVAAVSTSSVSGVLSVGADQVLDGDTNDPNDPIIDNNSLVGQEIVIPVTVGGYASLPENALGEADVFDIYRINVAGPTKIVLSIAQSDPEVDDLDLLLTDLDGVVIKESLGTGRFEVLETGPEEVGDFLVIVEAYEGASSYILSLGLSTAIASSPAALKTDSAHLSLDAEFVADQVIVKPNKSMSQTRMKSMATSFGLVAKTSSPSGVILMDLKDVDKSTSMQHRKNAARLSPFRYRNQKQAAKAHQLNIIKKMRRDPAIAYAEPNYIRHTSAIPNDAYYSDQWHYPLINLPQAWDITTGSENVVVAVIDTGVVLDHPDLSGRLLSRDDGSVIGFDFIKDPQRARDEDGIDANPYDSGDSNSGTSSSFHGTHVAGTIGAATNNQIGVAGVAWNTSIMPIRALGVGGGTTYDIAQGIRYAAGLANDSGIIPPVKANVINLSLGTANPLCETQFLDETSREALEDAQNAGVIVIVAAGNDAEDDRLCNAPDPNTTVNGVISVSAVNIAKQRASYSNSGPAIDVAAPGGNISEDLDGDGTIDGVLSTLADDSSDTLGFSYAWSAGTSMAAPHVAGVVALMLAVNPGLTADDINLLLAGEHPDPNAGPITQDLGDTGRDDIFGNGLIDAFQAVNVARVIEGGVGGTAPPDATPVLSVSPESLNFGATSTSLQLTLSNAGTGTLDITEVSDDAAWLEVDVSDLTNITVTVERSGLAEGSSRGTISIVTNGGSKSVPVSIKSQSFAVGGDVGTVFVLALDPDTLSTVAQTITNVTEGYAYQIADVVGGAYVVIAGTDRDNDGIICDNGEACGRFPRVDSPSTVTVDGDVTGIDFAEFYSFFAADESSAPASTPDSGKFSGFRRLK